MKNTLRIPSLISVFVVLFAGAIALARQTPVESAANPCNELSAADKKKDAAEYEPLVDPAEVLRLRNQRKLEEKNFKELQDTATQLATISAKMSQEIDNGGQYVISLRVLDELDQIEKLTKKVRSRVK